MRFFVLIELGVKRMRMTSVLSPGRLGQVYAGYRPHCTLHDDPGYNQVCSFSMIHLRVNIDHGNVFDLPSWQQQQSEPELRALKANQLTHLLQSGLWMSSSFELMVYRRAHVASLL